MCSNVSLRDYQTNKDVMERQELISLICDGKSMEEISSIMRKSNEEIHGILENIKKINKKAYSTLKEVLHD